jgi:hypothetical protein
VDPRVDLGGPDLLRRLSAWAAAARADDAATARSRQRWLRQAAEEDATFAGVLLDLAERRLPVVVTGRAGRRHRCTVTGVGADFALVRVDGTDALLSFTGIASVRPESSRPAAAGDRAVDIDVTMAEALAVVAEERPRVLVVTLADADGLAGELRSVGRDVATLRLDGTERATAYVPIASIAELRLA